MKRLIGSVWLSMLVLLVLIGCDQLKKITEPQDNTAPEAYIDVVQSVGIGEKVTLDGSSSTDADGDNLSFNWEFLEKPASSQTTISNSTDEQASFIPDARGTYKIRLTVSDGTDDGTANASVSANVPEINTIDQNTVLEDIFDDPSEVDYRVSSTINVNAVLTINPGVRIEFASGASMDIESEGSIVAVGTETDSIVFTGETETPGFWDCLYINANNPNNELSYCVVEYAGGYHGDIYVTNQGQLKLTHSSIRYSGSYGLSADGDAKFPSFASNRFVHNSAAAVELSAAQLGMLDSDTDYALGNTNNYVYVNSDNVDTDQTWPAINVPYLLNGTTNLNAEVTVEAGATLMFDSGAELDVESNGKLVAVGTETDSIRFTGALPTEGYWETIYINSNNPGNELSYCSIEYAGGWKGNIYITNDGQLKMTHSTSSHSALYGLNADSNAKLPAFSDNRFEGNLSAALNIPARLVGSVDGTSQYIGGNADDVIDVYSSYVNTAQTWPATDAPYRFSGTTNLEAAVTVEPGATIKFASGAGIDVETDGSLTAAGTATDSITFTGEIETEGYWETLYINSNNPANELSYCNIGYGGDWHANVYVTNGGQLKLNHSYIHDSADYGVSVDSDGVIDPINPETDGNNTFSNNASGNVNLP